MFFNDLSLDKLLPVWFWRHFLMETLALWICGGFFTLAKNWQCFCTFVMEMQFLILVPWYSKGFTCFMIILFIFSCFWCFRLTVLWLLLAACKILFLHRCFTQSHSLNHPAPVIQHSIRSTGMKQWSTDSILLIIPNQFFWNYLMFFRTLKPLLQKSDWVF